MTPHEAGFIYHGPHDKVECILCKGTINQWVWREDPATSHDHAFPHCSNAKPVLDCRLPNFESKPAFMKVYQTSVEARYNSFKYVRHDTYFPA